MLSSLYGFTLWAWSNPETIYAIIRVVAPAFLYGCWPILSKIYLAIRLGIAFFRLFADTKSKKSRTVIKGFSQSP
jgi:hypothetical protein